MTRASVVISAGLLVGMGALTLSAAERHSNYAGLEARDIKALSAQEVGGLLAGEGMSASLPAELNGFPGPRHVIELADQLGLTNVQRARATEIEAGMKQSATKLGAEIVGLEGALERLFRGGGAEPNRMEHLTREIGTKRGILRSIHLGAHLAVADTLTADQRARYMVLRGYSTGHRVSPHHERRH